MSLEADNGALPEDARPTGEPSEGSACHGGAVGTGQFWVSCGPQGPAVPREPAYMVAVSLTSLESSQVFCEQGKTSI